MISPGSGQCQCQAQKNPAIHQEPHGGFDSTNHIKHPVNDQVVVEVKLPQLSLLESGLGLGLGWNSFRLQGHHKSVDPPHYTGFSPQGQQVCGLLKVQTNDDTTSPKTKPTTPNVQTNSPRKSCSKSCEARLSSSNTAKRSFWTSSK